MNEIPIKMSKGLHRLMHTLAGCTKLHANIVNGRVWLEFRASTDEAAQALAAHFEMPELQEKRTTDGATWWFTSEVWAPEAVIEVSGPFHDAREIDQGKIDRALAALVPDEPEAETEAGEQISDTGRSDTPEA